MKEEKIRMGMERTFNGWIRTGLMLLAIGLIGTEDVIDLEPEWFWAPYVFWTVSLEKEI